MIQSTKKIKALGLCSGGLDSILSALVLREQGIDVEWITFETPFFSPEKAEKASGMTGIPLHICEITDAYLKMLKNPSCGYGKNMNPCLDCHTLMFRFAGERLRAEKFNFLFSGEVLGQRPMSQTRPSLRHVEKHSGFEGYILRPLSAKKLTETIPEKEGLVDRNRLLDFSGRSRKPQIKLAKKLGVTDYPAPAGGCLLTDKGYTIRLKDLFANQDDYLKNELHLLKYGRHFRFNNAEKVIVGRTKEDNEKILKYHNSATDTVLRLEHYPGPIVLIPDCQCKNDTIMLAASMCAGYSKAPQDKPVNVEVVSSDKTETVQATGVPPAEVKKFIL